MLFQHSKCIVYDKNPQFANLQNIKIKKLYFAKITLLTKSTYLYLQFLHISNMVEFATKFGQHFFLQQILPEIKFCLLDGLVGWVWVLVLRMFLQGGVVAKFQ